MGKTFAVRKNKMNAKRTPCKSGHLHHSAFEAGYCDTLHWMLKGKQLKNVVTQFRVYIVVNGVSICRHDVDFLVTKNDDTLEFHEYKGFETPDWKLKKKLTEALYPEIKYIVIKKDKKWKKTNYK